MKWIERLLLLGVVFLLPLAILTGAVNLVARMPDFYQYEFNRADTARELSLSVTNAELADFFARYMRGKPEELTLEQENLNTGEMENIFLPEEREAMGRLRAVLNVASLLAGAVAALTAAEYYALIRRFGAKRQLRRAFLLSAFVCAAYGAAWVYLLRFSGMGGSLRVFFAGEGLPEEALLRLLFTEEFFAHAAVAVAAVAVIAHIVLGMVTWSVSRPYRMFQRQRERR